MTFDPRPSRSTLAFFLALLLAHEHLQAAHASDRPLTQSERREVYEYSKKAKERRDLGDLPGAIGYLERALELSPDDPVLVYSMAYVRELTKDYRSAFDFYRRCLGRDVRKEIRAKARDGLTRLEPILELGRLVLELEPASASVFIAAVRQIPDVDGTLFLPRGEQVLLIHQEGCQARSEVVEIRAGEITTARFALMRDGAGDAPGAPCVEREPEPPLAHGIAIFEVRPKEAEILVDGDAVTLDAEGRVELSVGEHYVELVAEGHQPEDLLITIALGKPVTVRRTLKPSPVESAPPPSEAPAPTPVRPELPAVLVFRLAPRDAAIRIDGVTREPDGWGRLEVPAGKRRIELVAAGHESETFELSVGEGASAEVVRILKPKAPQLVQVTFAIEPRNATMRIDDEVVRLDRRNRIELMPGKRRVDLEADGYAAKTFELDLREGKPAKVRLRLDPIAPQAPPVVPIIFEITPRNARITLDGAIHTPGPGGRSVLTPGEHLVELDAEGFERESFTITVREGEPATIGRILRPFVPEPRAPTPVPVVFRVQPGHARIRIDGALHTPGAGGKVALLPGDHLVEISADGYRSEALTIEVAEGTPTTVSKTLEPLPPPPKPVMVTFDVTPDEAEIRIGGQVATRDPRGRVSLLPGKHQVTLASRDHLSQDLEIDVMEGKPLTIRKTLARDPRTMPPPAPPPKPILMGTLVVKTTPADATVIVDKEIFVVEPRKGVSLLVGEHVLEVSAKGYKTKTIRVNIEPGKPRAEFVTLQRIAK